jgi:hypothetical protein
MYTGVDVVDWLLRARLEDWLPVQCHTDMVQEDNSMRKCKKKG